MNIFRTTLAIASLVIAAPAFAQATPESIADSILGDLKKGDAKSTIENLLVKAPLVETGPAEKINLIQTLDTFLINYGKVEGWELIGSRNASNKYVEHTYIVFQEKYALYAELKFYRGKEGWAVTSFSFKDTLDDLLEIQSREDFKQSFKSLNSGN